MTESEKSQTEPLLEKKKEKMDFDPSTKRNVPHKMVNNAYFVHKEWRERQERIRARKQARAEGRPVPGGEDEDEEPEFSFVANLILSVSFTAFMAVIIALLAGQFIQGDPLWGYRGKWTNWHTYIPSPPQTFTADYLTQFDGTNPDKPIYVCNIPISYIVQLAIKGDVFDVSAGRIHYGPGGPYHMFAGRDASRAYVTGCFQTHLTHDTRGFTPKQKQSLDQWHKFYDTHHKYYKVGTLHLPPIDPSSSIPEPCDMPVSQKP